MNYGIIDFEMTCDGKQENGKFIDDGRMKKFQREIISIGFLVCDDKYQMLITYSTYVKPIKNRILTDYCKSLTGITQSDVDNGKKSNNAFGDVFKICKQYSVDKIFSFGNMDKIAIDSSIKWNKKAKEKVKFLYAVKEQIVDINPIILKIIGCKTRKRLPGLINIAQSLNIETETTQNHNALNDAILLYKVCKNLNVEMDNLTAISKFGSSKLDK